MDPMKEALNRRIGKGLQITIIAHPGSEVELEGGEKDDEENKGSDLAPENKSLDAEEGQEVGESAEPVAAAPVQVDPQDSSVAVNKPRGSIFHRAEMAQAQKLARKGK